MVIEDAQLLDNPKNNYKNLKCNIEEYNSDKYLENIGKNFAQLFYDCSLLRSLPDISKWKTRMLVVMKSTFSGCSSLTL